MDPVSARLYYSFIIRSYHVGRNERYSISMLGDVLKNYSNMRVSVLLEIYCHSLYCLAQNDGKKIYTEFLI